MAENDPLLSPGQVAKMFGVHTKTLTRWVKAGKLPYIEGLGGHRRYRASTVEKLLEERNNSE